MILLFNLGGSGNLQWYDVFCFHLYESTGSQAIQWSLDYGPNGGGTLITIPANKFNNAVKQTAYFYPSTNSGNLSVTNNYSLQVPWVYDGMPHTDIYYDFVNMVYYGNHDVNIILNDISDYLDSIDSNTSDINSSLQSILSVLNTIAQRNPTDYTSQISGISSQISDLIDLQQDVADNTAEMIEQQEEIIAGIEQLNDFFSDDTFDDSSVSDSLPDNSSYNDPTESGFNTIFNTLKDTFTSSNYTDVVITVPFTNNKTITLPSDLLESHIPMSIINIIRTVYWFLICRYILKDIADYVNKAKSGDILNLSETNIKTEML